MQRKKYSNAFKEVTVRLVLKSLPEKSISRVSKELGLSPKTVSHWIQLYRSKTDPTKMEGSPSQRAEIIKLQKEIRKVTMERDILKKAASIFKQELP